MDKGKYVPNKDSRQYVMDRKPFNGSNLWGSWCPSTIAESTDTHYVVFSHGHHYPMFIYADGVWYENEDKSSRSTERQRSQCRPVPRHDTYPLNTATMCRLAVLGMSELRKRRILGRL